MQDTLILSEPADIKTTLNLLLESIDLVTITSITLMKDTEECTGSILIKYKEKI